MGRIATAGAKLNLYLDVLGRRPDGYHELETLFLGLPWGDRVEVDLSDEPGVRLEIAPPDAEVPRDAANLAWRAASAWLAARGPGAPPGVRVRLAKRAPPGAGLGGGSADAAAVLRLLDGAAGPLGDEALTRIAAALGADVPFFLAGGAAVGRGRGDVLEALPPPPPLDVVLILPDLANETAKVFATLAVRGLPAPRRGLREAVAALASGEAARLRRAHHNALAAPAEAAYPAFGRFVADVGRRLGRRPAVTGSGSALYDLPDPGEASAVLSRLEGLACRCLHLRT